LSNRIGEATFLIEHNNANSHLADVLITHAVSMGKEAIIVPVMTLDYYCNANSVWPSIIKMDVEGAEVDVLRGAANLISQKRTKWIISTHSSSLYDECSKIMVAAGYFVQSLEGFHHELICYPN
jgi:FkbM family methyltransferase